MAAKDSGISARTWFQSLSLSVFLDLDLVNDTEQSYFLSLTAGHVCCYTQSPNCDRDFIVTPCEGRKMWFYKGGLSKKNLDGWRVQYQKEVAELGFTVSDQDISCILDVTGAVPYLLEVVFEKVKTERKFDMSFLDHTQSILWELDEYMRQKSGDSTVQRIIIAWAITDSSVNPDEESDILAADHERHSPDRRFIYPMDGHWTTMGLVFRDALRAFMLSQGDIARYVTLQSWLDMLPWVKDNPVMLRFAIEGAITWEIAERGLSLRSKLNQQVSLYIPPGSKIRRYSGNNVPPIQESYGRCQIFVPIEFNFRYIDAMIVFFDNNTTTVHLCPIQTTCDEYKSNHSDSPGKTFTPGGDYTMWEQRVILPHHTWTKAWSFVWVLRREKKKDVEASIVTWQNISFVEWQMNFKQAGRQTGRALNAILK